MCGYGAEDIHRDAECKRGDWERRPKGAGRKKGEREHSWNRRKKEGEQAAMVEGDKSIWEEEDKRDRWSRSAVAGREYSGVKG